MLTLSSGQCHHSEEDMRNIQTAALEQFQRVFPPAIRNSPLFDEVYVLRIFFFFCDERQANNSSESTDPFFLPLRGGQRAVDKLLDPRSYLLIRQKLLWP